VGKSSGQWLAGSRALAHGSDSAERSNQFSTVKSANCAKSRALRVTGIKPLTAAMAAICVSA
jgi:hypothetical protein